MPPFRETPARVFLRFLRFGVLAWGGPVAQIAMIRRELVDEERWIGSSRFNRVLAVYQALPGPEAHELCVYFGHLAAGRFGGVLAGLGFMLPGFALMLVLAWAYVRFGIDVAALAGVFAGLQAGVLALIVRGAITIGRHALTDPLLWAIGVGGFVATLAGTHFAVVLITAGLVAFLVRRGRSGEAAALAAAVTILLAAVPALRQGEPFLAAAGGDATTTPAGLDAILLAGLAAGLLTFGGAYTSIPILQQQAVGTWMTPGQFLDGLALGGILPAPLIIFSTFVGYVGAGLAGALVMTGAVFLPAFAFTLVGYRHLERLVADERLHAFFDGITAGVVGLIAATTVRLVPAAITDLVGAMIAGAALAGLLAWRGRASIPVVMAGAALAGLLADLA